MSWSTVSSGSETARPAAATGRGADGRKAPRPRALSGLGDGRHGRGCRGAREPPRLAKLAADLRTIALVECGGTRPAARRCDLAVLARASIQSVWPLAHVQRKQVGLIGADAAWAVVDAEHVARALQDLLAFAVERSPRRGLVEVVVHAAGVSVAYDADGIPEGDHVALALAEAVGRLHGGGLAAAWEAGRVLLSLVVAPEGPATLSSEAA